MQDPIITYCWDLSGLVMRLLDTGCHTPKIDYDHSALAELLVELPEKDQLKITQQMTAFFVAYRNTKLFHVKETCSTINRRISRLEHSLSAATDAMFRKHLRWS
jgi:hypothetical protein